MISFLFRPVFSAIDILVFVAVILLAAITHPFVLMLSITWVMASAELEKKYWNIEKKEIQ